MKKFSLKSQCVVVEELVCFECPVKRQGFWLSRKTEPDVKYSGVIPSKVLYIMIASFSNL